MFTSDSRREEFIKHYLAASFLKDSAFWSKADYHTRVLGVLCRGKIPAKLLILTADYSGSNFYNKSYFHPCDRVIRIVASLKHFRASVESGNYSIPREILSRFRLQGLTLVELPPTFYSHNKTLGWSAKC